MNEPNPVVPYLVRLRPNAAYLAYLALSLIAVGLGTTFDGVIRIVTITSGGLLVVLLAAPVVISALFRVPVLVIDSDGVRLPLTGVHLAWSEVMRVRQAIEPKRRALLIVPADQSAVLRQMRPWLRAEGRSNIARYGTPIVLTSASVNRTIDETHSAIARLHPINVDHPGHPASPTEPDAR
jgi:hypothetical protein